MNKNKMYIKPTIFSDKVSACFSTKQGGISEGIYSSMNPDPRKSDDIKNVIENCRILGSAVGFLPQDMVMINQIHSDIIFDIGKENRGAGLFKELVGDADALITKEKNVALTIFTADCVPILLHDEDANVIAAVHAGWRGTALDIVGKTIRKMEVDYGCKAEDICASIGPAISRCCFETSEDVPNAMRRLLGEAAESLIIQKGEKFYVDLKEINKLLLERVGVNKIEISNHCTACETDLFWSHRRVGLQRGSLAAIIMLR